MNPLRKLQSAVGMHWHNARGWKTDRKIVVFESDDWGSERMPSKDLFEKLNKIKDINISNCPFSKNDSIENSKDVDDLINVIISFKDCNGNFPIITLNFVVANPNYVKIKQSNYNEYHYFELYKTYEKYGYKTLQTLFDGFNINALEPQFHGREHLNSNLYLKLLRGNIVFRNINELGLYFLSFNNLPSLDFPYLATFYPYGNNYLEEQKLTLVDGLRIFYKIFGSKAVSFIPPVYVWNHNLEETLIQNSIKSIQGLHISKDYGTKRTKIRKKYSKAGLINTHRNCFFEPTMNNYYNIDKTLQQIQFAFKYKRPAIISTHRLNFISTINESNGKNNLILLKQLLLEITKNWPDVEFKSTSQLISLLLNNEKNT